MMKVRDFLQFLSRPRLEVGMPLSGRDRVKEWFALLLTAVVGCLAVCFVVALSALLSGGERYASIAWQVCFDEESLKSLTLPRAGKYVAWGLFVAVAPVFYGLMFRYALGPFDWKRFRVSLGLLLMNVVFMLLWLAYKQVFEERVNMMVQYVLYYAVVALGMAVLYFGVSGRVSVLKRLGEYWEEYFPLFFYASVLLTVFLSPMSIYGWAALLVQGLVLGYAVLRLGFWPSVGLHACLNALTLLCVALA